MASVLDGSSTFLVSNIFKGIMYLEGTPVHTAVHYCACLTILAPCAKHDFGTYMRLSSSFKKNNYQKRRVLKAILNPNTQRLHRSSAWTQDGRSRLGIETAGEQRTEQREKTHGGAGEEHGVRDRRGRVRGVVARQAPPLHRPLRRPRHRARSQYVT